jgi:hypothetical protein
VHIVGVIVLIGTLLGLCAETAHSISVVPNALEPYSCAIRLVIYTRTLASAMDIHRLRRFCACCRGDYRPSPPRSLGDGDIGSRFRSFWNRRIRCTETTVVPPQQDTTVFFTSSRRTPFPQRHSAGR